MDSDKYKVITGKRSRRPRGQTEASVWGRRDKVDWEGMSKQKLKKVKFSYRLGRDGKGRRDVSGFRGIWKPGVLLGESGWAGESFSCPFRANAKKIIHRNR